jgi:hypothetical protein
MRSILCRDDKTEESCAYKCSQKQYLRFFQDKILIPTKEIWHDSKLKHRIYCHFYYCRCIKYLSKGYLFTSAMRVRDSSGISRFRKTRLFSHSFSKSGIQCIARPFWVTPKKNTSRKFPEVFSMYNSWFVDPNLFYYSAKASLILFNASFNISSLVA